MKQFLVVLSLFVTQHLLAVPIPYDSAAVAARFDSLAATMNIRQPKLKVGEHQVRLWVKVSLAYGDAQTLYVIDRTRKGLFLSDYSLEWKDHRTVKRVFSSKKHAKDDTAVWQQLVALGVLSLPDQSTLHDQIYPKPKPFVNNKVVVTADSGVVVKAARMEPIVFISDGTSYTFQTFSHDSRRTYSYHCPQGYAKVRTKVVELKKAVSLLRQVFQLFNDQSNICLRYTIRPAIFS